MAFSTFVACREGSMKLHFEPDLDYQKLAIESVADLFRGQEITHADKHHMVFRLDAVDAYERKLVKQIEVASMEVEGGFNKAYVRFISPAAREDLSRHVSRSIFKMGRPFGAKRLSFKMGTTFKKLPSARSMPIAGLVRFVPPKTTSFWK
jgi:hypothetical protein